MILKTLFPISIKSEEILWMNKIEHRDFKFGKDFKFS